MYIYIEYNFTYYIHQIKLYPLIRIYNILNATTTITVYNILKINKHS